MTGRSTGTPGTEHVAVEVLSLLSRKWHPVVVLTLHGRGSMGFNDVLETIPDVSGKVLSETLEDLQNAGLVERTVVNESPLRVEYGLTEAGRDMEPIFDALTEWGEQHLERASPTVLLADGDPRITEMFEQWLTGRYRVVRAHHGEDVRDRLGDEPDVLMLERTLPGADTAALLETVPSECRTVLCLSERPRVDLLELDCDDVLRKPIVRDTALETVETQLARRGASQDRRERAALEAKCSLLETVHSRERLAESSRFREASRRIEALEERLED